MTFDNVQHPRDTDGKFAEKLGAAPEIGLQGPASVGDIRDLVRKTHPEATKVAFQDQDNGGPRIVAIHDGSNAIIDYGVGKFEGLDEALDRLPGYGFVGALDFEVVQTGRFSKQAEELAGYLGHGSRVTSADITRTDVDRLRNAVNNAEFRLAENEVRSLLQREAPGSIGVVVAEDDEGNAYPLGIETTGAIDGIGRNWGVIDYDNIPDGVRDWFITDGYRLSRDGHLDDFSSQLTNSYGDFDDDNIIWDGRPVYRVAD